MPRAPRPLIVLLTALAVTLLPLGLLAPTASAAGGQTGAPQVVLNPGGGLRADGTDGIRFTVNNTPDTGSHPVSRAGVPGQDSVVYRGTEQYCCTAGAPYLAVGTAAFGQAGALYGNQGNAWTSISVLSTGGSASTGDTLPGTTGNASVRLRYVATKNGLEYTMDRTLSYTYPNDFVTDAYTFTIPTGNTEQVKFYLGGDTAPGGSDQGYGVMLTDPVRSVISLNTSSQIQFGFREAPESKPFDGATSQRYSTPYPIVLAGGNIGFIATNATHDAGLMVQWNLGSAPGTQSASLQQFVNKQGLNLNAGFDRTFTTAGAPVALDISVVNTNLTPADSLGYTIALPAGTVVAAGATSNTCGGTLAAAVGGTEVSLTGGSVRATANCVASVPVVASTYGTYTMAAANVTALAGGLTNNVGTTAFFVPLAPAYPADRALGDLAVGRPATESVAADGAPPPSYAVVAGSLPANLRLDAETGAVTGTPSTAGPYSFTVRATNAGGTADHTFTGTVARGLPPLTGTTDPQTAVVDQTVTLTAADLPKGATGTLTFTTGDRTLCSVTLPTRVCEVADLAPGSYPVAVTYSGDANWEPRTLALPSLDVQQAPSELGGELSSTTIRYGTRATVTATLAPAQATGTITVSTGSRTLCTLTLPDTSCQTPTNLAAGTHTLALAYSGDDRYLGSSTVLDELTVERATPDPGPDSSFTGTFGRPTPVDLAGLPADATGTVTVTVDGTEVCRYDLADDPASCEVPGTLPAGSHALVLAYSGDDNYEPSSRTTTLLVDRASTALTAPEDLSGRFGTATTVRFGGLPEGATGTVTVSVGDTVLCRADVPEESSCDIPAGTPAGEYAVVVAYSGDADHLGSSTPLQLRIAQQVTEVSAAARVRTTFGTPGLVEVGGLPAGATGTVTVSGGPIGTECTIELPADPAECETSGRTPAGTYTLTVRYEGDADHAPSETTLELVVDRQPTALTSPATAEGTFGTSGTLAVAGLPSGATGTVTATARRGDADPVELCSFPVPAVTSCAWPADLPAGTYEVTLRYSGDADYAGSTSTTTLALARQPITTLGASVTPERTVYGAAVLVQVLGLPGTATGTVTVTGPGGSTECTIDAADEERSCTTSGEIPVGEQTLTLSYSGDADHEPASTTVALVVDKVPTELTATDPEVGTTSGQRARVGVADAKGATGVVVVTYPGPDGPVEFCRFTLPDQTSCRGPADLPAGVYALTLTYAGDANHGPWTSQVTLRVAGAPVPDPEPEPTTPPVVEPTTPPAPAPVPPSATAPGHGGLARTGGPGPALLGLGAVLLALGGGVLLRARRSR